MIIFLDELLSELKASGRISCPSLTAGQAQNEEEERISEGIREKIPGDNLKKTPDDGLKIILVGRPGKEIIHGSIGIIIDKTQY